MSFQFAGQQSPQFFQNQIQPPSSTLASDIVRLNRNSKLEIVAILVLIVGIVAFISYFAYRALKQSTPPNSQPILSTAKWYCLKSNVGICAQSNTVPYGGALGFDDQDTCVANPQCASVPVTPTTLYYCVAPQSGQCAPFTSSPFTLPDGSPAPGFSSLGLCTSDPSNSICDIVLNGN